MHRSLRIALLCALLSVLVVPVAGAEQFFVRFNDGSDKLANEQWLKEAGIRVVRKFQLTEAILCETIDKSAAPMQALEADPRVMYTAPNRTYKVVGVPDDPSFAQQWSLRNTGQTGGTPGADISAVEAWDLVGGAQEVLVAIIDTGIEYTHPDLAARMWDGGPEYPNHGWDFGNNDDDPMPDHYHGTHVAGTVAAGFDNGVGVAGIAPNARLMALKASLDGADEFDNDKLIAAMDFAAANGADVINASYGALYANPHQPTLEAMQRLHDAGVVFVAAAGNDGEDLDTYGQLFYPACYEVPNVVSVAATDEDDVLASFTNYGSQHVDLAAPGTDILSATLNGAYTNSSGTSMAAPHVTGAVALLRGMYPGLTPAEVRSILMEGATPLSALSRTTISGGRLDLVGMLSAADTVAPGAVTDLAVAGEYADSMRLTWTAVGDDGYAGIASVNDLRYATTPIVDASDFAAATRVNDLTAPRAAGQPESILVTGLAPLTTYHFALSVGDDGGNWSPLALASGATDNVSLAVLDETPRSYALNTGEQSIDTLVLENAGSGSLGYLVRAVSVGLAKSARSVHEPVPATRPYDAEQPARSSGRGKSGPSGASGFHALAPTSAEKSADWGTLFHDDMELDAGFWTADVIGGTNLWHYSAAAYNSPSQSLAFADPVTGDYDTGAALDVAMTSGTIDLTGAEGDVALEFYEWYATELGYDFCDVEASADGGQTWTLLRAGVSGDSGGWRLTSVDLGAYAGQLVNVRFRFRTGDALYNDHPGWYVDDVSVRDDGTSWLAFVYGSGTVPAYQTRSISYKVDARGLCSGTYEAEIQVHTNDPAHPLFAVPISLQVTSAADLHYATVGLDMGSEYVGYTETRVFELANIGCSPLVLSGLASSSPEFAVNLSATTVAPGEAAELTVAYTPSAAAPGFSMITFATNDPGEPAVTLIAFGTGELAPEIALPETSYTEQVSGESVWSRSFEIRNDGDGPLEWQFAGDLNADGSPATERRVLFGWDSADLHTIVHQRVADAGYATAFVEELDPVNKQFTAAMLDDADVVVLYGYRVPDATEIGLLADFVEDGGGLFLDMYHHPTYANFEALLAALGTGITLGDEDNRNEVMVPVVDHRLSEGVDGVYAGHTLNLENINSPMEVFLRSDSGWDVQAFGSVGKGRVFLSTAPFTRSSYMGNADNATMVDNLYAWLAEGALTMVPGSGTVAPGATQTVDVRFDAGAIYEGTWVYDFYVASNDPAAPVVPVQATYELDGTGHIYLPQNQYHMGLVHAAVDTSTFIELYNSGNGPVFIQGVTSSNPRFNPKPAQMLLAPKERKDLQVRLQAGAEGGVVTEIAIAADSPGQDDLRFLVDANPQLPHVSVSTTTLDSVTLYTGAATVQTFDVTNAGQWPLEFTVDTGANPDYMSVGSGGVITLAAGETEEMQVRYRANTECGVGTLSSVFTIASNDQTVEPTVDATLTVVDAQHIVADYDGHMSHYVGIPRGVTQIVVVTNVGCLDLDVTNVTVSGQYFSLVSFTPSILAPGEQTSFRVNFNPLEGGTFWASVDIYSDDPDDPDLGFAIEGEGIEFGAGGETPEPVDTSMSATPNPFNPSTTINFYVPKDGRAAVRVYNLRGQLVRELDAGLMTVGRGSVEWNGRDRRGTAVASGVYFYQLHVDGRQVGETGRATLLK